MANPYIRSAAAMAGGVADRVTNAPAQYSDRQRQFLAGGTSAFAEKYARYASDYMAARVQGLDPQDRLAWSDVYLRLSDLGRPTATTTKLTDDYKRVLIPGREIDYLMPGAKIETMGSTWLAINPNNVSGVGAGGLVQRCNAAWRYLDFYGNVKSEPMAVDRYLSRANNTDTQEAMNLTKGYFDVKCQYNEATAQLAENSRIILGRNCYRITGFSDFTQEFTDDYDTVRLLEFSIHYEEPNLTIDDMENYVAGGKMFSWEIKIEGAPNLTAGEDAQFTATSQRNNEDVISTEDHPITYLWTSSDESVATVDESGVVHAVAEGGCVITATLTENPAMAAQMAFTVAPVIRGGHVRMKQTAPQSLSLHEILDLEAVYCVDGEETDQAVEWETRRAAPEAYSAQVNGNQIRIRCWAGSVEPLEITASCQDASVTLKIKLEGL